MTAPQTQTAPRVTFEQVDSLAGIQAAAWDRLNPSGCPFLTHAFLHGLEQHDCLEAHGWIPAHLIARVDQRLAGAVPLYIKTNSFGEFVFDWAWADAYERAGGDYYPKLVAAIPFTPVRGPRLLIDPGLERSVDIRRQLAVALLDLSQQSGLSSFHCLFPDQEDQALLVEQGLLARKGIQFHWHNPGYRDFTDFLDHLTAKKRKQIKRERRRVSDQGIEVEILTGDQISGRQWDCFHEFYCSTFHRRWGSPRLTREFMYSLSENLPRQTLLLLARRNNTYVAGAFAMLDDQNLYGRHWGCSRKYEDLHFELCYYRTIEYCIEHGLQTVDAGVQGEHKISRGFRPVQTWSCHWLRHSGFRRAVRDYLAHENPAIDSHVNELNLHLPYKSIDSE